MHFWKNRNGLKPMTARLLDISRSYWLKRGVTDEEIVTNEETAKEMVDKLINKIQCRQRNLSAFLYYEYLSIN